MRAFIILLKRLFFILNFNSNLISENGSNRDLLEHCRKEDDIFVSTNASRNVEELSKSKNLVIVAGHSGCGKSATVQHIALQYRREGWDVKPVDTIEEIKETYVSETFTENKTVCVYHDPIGKESYNEI